MLERIFSFRLLLKIEQDSVRVKASFDFLISKFDHDFERFRTAIDVKNKLLIRQRLTDSFLLCRWHNDNLHERKCESNAILWKIINETIWNENLERIEMIFKNKNHSKSSKSQNLIMSELVHCQSATREVRRLWYSAIDGPAMDRNWLVSELREITRLGASTSCN
jgi:hypothetical protein